MTDRELLEMAAKAGEYNVSFFSARNLRGFSCGFTHAEDGGDWNPLDDDGDALRLAVTLGLDVECLDFATQVNYDIRGILYRCNIGKNEGKCNGDIYVATRQAIVYAAAEIGKAMP